MTSKDYLTIGEVVARLKPTYPDLSLSKLRFLEDEGLICPDRTPSGYRKYRKSDTERLEHILRLQRDHFLPLSVIKERLVALDSGKEIPELAGKTAASEHTSTDNLGSESMTVRDCSSQMAIPESFIHELDSFGLIELATASNVRTVAPDDSPTIKAAWELRKLGIEPRHLRMYATFSERESSLFEQILVPTFRHRTPESRKRLNEAYADIGNLTDLLKGRLLRKSLEYKLKDLM